MEHTIEYQNWGWNALTISAVMTVVLTFIQSWGLYRQAKTIWQHRRAEAVSVSWNCCFAAVFVAIAIYGMATSSIALVVNGVVSIFFYIPILVGLARFKGFRPLEQVTAFFLAAGALGMAASQYKDWFFFGFSAVSTFSIMMQLIEMYSKGNARDVNIRLLLSFLVGSFFWSVYGYAIHDWVLQIMAPIAAVLFGSTVALWYVYKFQGKT